MEHKHKHKNKHKTKSSSKKKYFSDSDSSDVKIPNKHKRKFQKERNGYSSSDSSGSDDSDRVRVPSKGWSTYITKGDTEVKQDQVGMPGLLTQHYSPTSWCAGGGRWTPLTWVEDSGHPPVYSPQHAADKVRRKMDRCKLKHRTSLKLEDWQNRYNFSKDFPAFRDMMVRHVDEVVRQWKYGSTSTGRSVSTWCDHVHVKDLSVESFVQKYEAPYKPVVLSGLADMWAGKQMWRVPDLATGPYRNVKLKCGEDDDGYSVKIRLKYFLQYQHDQGDDSPLYLFDSSFEDHPVAKGLMNDYSLPHYFRADLFRLVGEKRRPPYRWWLMGPERSGSSVHIDPLGTSAWNTLLTGQKLWVLFPPDAPKKLVKGEHLKQKGEDGEAITYFERILPRIRAEEERKVGGPTLGMMELIQYPGETIFVPGGWWHAVLNLTDTTAVTQNFVSSQNFPIVWKKTRKGRKHMAKRWMDALDEHYPELGEQAHKMNSEDSFEFIFSDKKKKKKKKKEKEKKRKSSSDSD